MINILFYETSSGFGGSASALANIVRKIGLSIKPLAITKSESPYLDKIEHLRIIRFKNYTDYEELNKLTSFKFLLQLVTDIIPEFFKIFFVIKRHRISLVHINNNINAGLLAVLAAKIAGVPCVCHIRQTRKLLKRELLILKLVDRCIVLNKQVYDSLKLVMPENRLKFVYDGLDLNQFIPMSKGAFRREFNEGMSPIVGIVGRIVSGKGHLEFIKAGKLILEQKPNVKFTIVGDAPVGDYTYLNELKDAISNERLSSSFIFTGWRKDLHRLIADFDIIVQPYTLPEGLPNVIMEAMALGKPVISTNIAGPNEILINGETGFLVPPGDVKALAEKILYLLDNPAVAKKMGENGRRRAEQLFDINSTLSELQNIYNGLLRKEERLCLT